jgi:hypothetical protein
MGDNNDDFIIKVKRQKPIPPIPAIPTQEELYQLVLTLTERVKNLEQTQYKRTKSTRITKTLDTNEWLKRLEMPEMTYKEWLEQIQATQEDIQLLFIDPTNLSKVVENILKKDLKKPITNVPNEPNIFYAYNEDEKNNASWMKLNQKIIDILLRTIQQRISRELIIWKENNGDKLGRDEELNNVYCKIMNTVFSTITNKCQKPMWSKISDNIM